jgi:hypothetical protein
MQMPQVVRACRSMSLDLVLFELGSRLYLRWIGRNVWLMLSSVAEAMMIFILALAVQLFLHVPTMVAMVIPAITIDTSPAVVIQSKTEPRAKGQVTQCLVRSTALNSMSAVAIENSGSGFCRKFNLVTLVTSSSHASSFIKRATDTDCPTIGARSCINLNISLSPRALAKLPTKPPLMPMHTLQQPGGSVRCRRLSASGKSAAQAKLPSVF